MGEYRAQQGEAASPFSCQSWGTWVEKHSPDETLDMPLESSDDENDQSHSDNESGEDKDKEIAEQPGQYARLFLEEVQVEQMMLLCQNLQEISTALSKEDV
jgi:hypothetical protein